MYIAVGVVILGHGALAGRVGAKVGIALALAPLAVWFAVLVWFIWSGTLDSQEGGALAGYLLIGLLAFVVGQVSVGVNDHCRGGVPEHFLHGLHVRAGADRKGRRRVPQSLRRDARDALIDLLRSPRSRGELCVRIGESHAVRGTDIATLRP